jgi:hypothetical protein
MIAFFPTLFAIVGFSPSAMWFIIPQLWRRFDSFDRFRPSEPRVARNRFRRKRGWGPDFDARRLGQARG